MSRFSLSIAAALSTITASVVTGDEKVYPVWQQWQQFPTTGFTRGLIDFFNAYPFVGILLCLMLADVLLGILVAFVTRTLSSGVSFKGMCKKAAMLILVGVGAVIQAQAGLPVAKMLASLFTCTELLSIIEAAAILGLPLPAPLVEALTKFKVFADYKSGATTTTTTITTPAGAPPTARVIVRAPTGQVASAKIEIPPRGED